MAAGQRQPRKARTSLDVGGKGSFGSASRGNASPSAAHGADSRRAGKGSGKDSAKRSGKGSGKGGRGGARGKGSARTAAPSCAGEAALVNRLIVVGSPREGGRCMHLADLLFEACIEDCPTDEVALAPVATLSIAPCTGCNACRCGDDGFELRSEAEAKLKAEEKNPPEAPDVLANDGAEPACASAALCVIDDDMAEVRELIDSADELIVVSPVYFSGPPAQFKALLDRMQPYFWAAQGARRRNRAAWVAREKRPLVLHVVGEGDDPYGYAPLVSVVRSAFAAAGFALEAVYDWVGKIDERGEIVAEADVIPAAAFDGCALHSSGEGDGCD